MAMLIWNKYIMKKQSSEQRINKIPIEMKLAKSLGIQQLLLRNFVFKAKQSKYQIKKVNGRNVIIINQQIYEPPKSYFYQVLILEQEGYSVPVCHFIPSQHLLSTNINNMSKKSVYLIYAHGNSSDLCDSIKFLEQLCILFSALSSQQHTNMQFFKKHQIHLIAFDYTGYGQSRIKNKTISEKTICVDLQMVLSWVNSTKRVSLDQIILWGFSLGTFPVSYCSSLYNIRGCILQSPIASISCFLKNNENYEIQTNQRNSKIIDIEDDYLSNLKFIGKINCQILIIHSSSDDVIPFFHSKILMQRYQAENFREKIEFLETNLLKHNQMHKYFCSPIANPLREKMIQFILRAMTSTYENLSFQSSFYSLNSSNCSQGKNSYSSTRSPHQSMFSSYIDAPISSNIKNRTKPSQHIQLKKKKNNYGKLKELYEELKEAQFREQTQIEVQIQFQNGIRKQKIKNQRKKILGCNCFERC